MTTTSRKSCRAILLTPSEEVLLIKIGDPSGGWLGWITPGGGINNGESEIEALRRELFEELGLSSFSGAAKVWSHSLRYLWNGKWLEQDETFFLIRTEKFEPSNAKITANEKLEFHDTRWWTLDEIRNSNEAFGPHDLAQSLTELLSLPELPREPIRVGLSSR